MRINNFSTAHLIFIIPEFIIDLFIRRYFLYFRCVEKPLKWDVDKIIRTLIANH